MGRDADLLTGTLDLLILKAVSRAPLHGYGILLRIQQLSRALRQIEQDSLYPALYRLEHQGLLSAKWSASDNNRRARYYRLTPAGRIRLQRAAEQWRRQSAAVEYVLGATPQASFRAR